MAPKIGEHPDRHACAHSACIGELAVLSVVAQQQRPQMRP